MEMDKAEETKKLLSSIQSLKHFKVEMGGNLTDMLACLDVCRDFDYGADNYDFGEYVDADSVDVEKELSDVDYVKYKTYCFAVTQVKNKIKELEERIAGL
mgnify:CR=1 FL=1|jgi:hypothetical protein|tara:strand:- start:356 stop:655 length:300 start_codon:yes stop_codon:yes gene_type:complete